MMDFFVNVKKIGSFVAVCAVCVFSYGFADGCDDDSDVVAERGGGGRGMEGRAPGGYGEGRGEMQGRPGGDYRGYEPRPEDQGDQGRGAAYEAGRAEGENQDNNNSGGTYLVPDNLYDNPPPPPNYQQPPQ